MSSTTYTAWGIPSTASKVTDLQKLTKQIPKPGPKQVLLRIVAVSLNSRDLLVAKRSPHYSGTSKDNLVPCNDGAGVVHSTGEGSLWADRIGSRVIVGPGTFMPDDFRTSDLSHVLGAADNDGTLQEYLIVDERRLVLAPKGLSLVESSTLMCAGGSAWWAIRSGLDMGLNGEVAAWKGDWQQKRLAGKSILTMGTGGVSCFGIQIASALGATVIATSSSDRKLELAKSLGATHVVNYASTPEWGQEVLRITGGKGVDHVLEVGGAGTMIQSLNATRPAGLISVIGILSGMGPLPADFVPRLLSRAKTIRSVFGFTCDTLTEFVQFVESNDIKPLIAQEFEFEEAIKAFETLENQGSVGKIVIKVSQE